MIKVDWSECLLKEDIAVAMSAHALDRAIQRGQAPIQQVRKEIENLIQAAEPQLIELSNKFKTFVLKGKNKLAVVGALIRKGKDYIFKVITLHKKDNFIPNNPDDKVISVQEDLIPGGKGDNIDLSQFSIEQIIKGLQVEKEHTNNVYIALEIVADHLTENPFYYDTYNFPELNSKNFSKNVLDNNKGENKALNTALNNNIMDINNEPQEDYIFLSETENSIITHLKQVFKEGLEKEANGEDETLADKLIEQVFLKQPKGIEILSITKEDYHMPSKVEDAEADVDIEGSITVTDDYMISYRFKYQNEEHEVGIGIVESRELIYKGKEADGYKHIDVYQDSEWVDIYEDGGRVKIKNSNKEILDKIFNFKNKPLKWTDIYEGDI
jgi:hypothetical protein